MRSKDSLLILLALAGALSALFVRPCIVVDDEICTRGHTSTSPYLYNLLKSARNPRDQRVRPGRDAEDRPDSRADPRECFGRRDDPTESPGRRTQPFPGTPRPRRACPRLP